MNGIEEQIAIEDAELAAQQTAQMAMPEAQQVLQAQAAADTQAVDPLEVAPIDIPPTDTEQNAAAQTKTAQDVLWESVQTQTAWNDITASLAERGVEVRVSDALGEDDGTYQNGVITISSKAKNPVLSVLKHELTHYIEGTPEYEKLSNYIIDLAANEAEARGGNIDTLLQGIMQEYAPRYATEGRTFGEQDARRELVAKYVASRLFTNEAAITELVNSNRTLAGKIKSWLTYAISKFKARNNPELRSLIEAERLYTKALAAADGKSGGRQYSIELDSKGREFVKLDRDIFVDADGYELPENQWSEKLTEWLNSNAMYGMTIPTSDGKTLTITSTTADEMAKFNDNMNPDQYHCKLLAAAQIDELAQVSKHSKYGKNEKPKHSVRAAKGWEYRDAYFSDGENLYRARISVAMGEDVNELYNIGYISEVERAINKKGTPTVIGSPEQMNAPATILNDEASGYTLTDIISSPSQNSNPQNQKSTGDSFDDLIAKYGAIKAGAEPRVDIEVPVRTEDGKKVMMTVRTFMEAPSVSDMSRSEFKSAVERGEYSYAPISDNAAISNAQHKIERDGLSRSLGAWKRRSGAQLNKYDVALAETLMLQAQLALAALLIIARFLREL